MSLSDLYYESEEAFSELLNVIDGSTITFNGVSKPCISQTISIKKMQELQGYQLDASTSVVMLVADFDAFDGLQERVSKLQVNDGDEMVYVTKDVHPNSATVTLFLKAPG